MKKKKYITPLVVSLIFLFLVSSGIVFFIHQQNKKKAEIQAENLAAEKNRETLKNEITQLNKQEKELKEQFANCQRLSEKKLIKEKLTPLQSTLFDKKEHLRNLAPASTASTLKDKKNLDKKQLANSLKKELKQQLEELKNGTGDEGDIQSNPLFKYYFARHYLEEKDCQEIEVLIGQIQKLQKEKETQARIETEQKLVNNPKLFEYRSGMSTKRNGGWQSYHSFYGKHKGWEFKVYVPDNHPALNNVLFNDGWGTNAEIGNFYLIEGIKEPTEFKYWNKKEEKMETISEAEAAQAVQEGKEIFYEKFIDLKDEITINYFQEGEKD